MGNKKKNKKKEKKINSKKEKYAKFRKDKPDTTSYTPPELTAEQLKQRQEDDNKISKFLRFSKNPRTKEILKRKEMSKR